jgi:hypothetical protein
VDGLADSFPLLADIDDCRRARGRDRARPDDEQVR